MNSRYKHLGQRLKAKTTFWQIGLFQAFLLVVAFTAWRVLRSPSTMGFFAFELGVALTVGLFLHLRSTLAGGQSGRGESGNHWNPHHGIPQTPDGSPAPERKTAASEDPESSEALAIARTRHRIFVGLNGLFLGLVALAFLDLSRSLYTASLQFYVLVAISAGMLSVNVHVNGDRRPASLLLQIVILAVLVKFYFLYLNPYVYTSDTTLYFNGLLDLEATHHIPASLGHYFFFPSFATFAYAGTRLAGVPLELFGAFGFISQIALVLLVFLIGRRLATPKMGLFAAMFAVFSVFTFLYTHAGPAYYGLAFIFLAVYASIRIDGGGGRMWFVVFWLSALTTLFSHPINALILALILAIRVAGSMMSRDSAMPRGPSVTPALSYGVAYGSYLAFVAYTAFDLFVRSFLVVDYAPPLATTPGLALERSASFVFQSALAPLGIVVPFLFAGYAVLARSRATRSEHRFLVTLGALFLLIPGLELLGGNFKLQSSRMLVYLAIPFVFLAASGLVSLSHGVAPKRRTITAILTLFFVFGLIASSSYLTQNDSRIFYTDIPFTPSHITDSALSSRQFMNLTPEGSTIYMEYGSWRYFADSNRAPNPLLGRSTPDLGFFQEFGGSGFVVLNKDFLVYGMPSGGALYNTEKIVARLQDQPTMLTYDSGSISIYYVP